MCVRFALFLTMIRHEVCFPDFKRLTQQKNGLLFKSFAMGHAPSGLCHCAATCTGADLAPFSLPLQPDSLCHCSPQHLGQLAPSDILQWKLNQVEQRDKIIANTRCHLWFTSWLRTESAVLHCLAVFLCTIDLKHRHLTSNCEWIKECMENGVSKMLCHLAQTLHESETNILHSFTFGQQHAQNSIGVRIFCQKMAQPEFSD